MAAEPASYQQATTADDPTPLCLATVCGIALDTSPAASLIFHRSQVIWRASAELHRMLGWPPLALDGFFLAALMPSTIPSPIPDILAIAFGERQTRRKTKYHKSLPVELLHKKGHTIPVDIIIVEPPAGIAEQLAIAHVLPGRRHGDSERR